MILLLTACRQRVAPSAYKKFVDNPDNGYIQALQTNTGKINCLYRPLDYAVVSELRSDHISSREFKSVKQELEGMEYFTLSVPYTDMQEQPEYYFYQMQSAIKLVQSKDTSDCVLYHAEQGGGINGRQDILLSFDRKLNDEIFSLHVMDYRKEGINLEFRFDRSSMKKLPLIQLN
jgi:hypothetical protein